VLNQISSPCMETLQMQWNFICLLCGIRSFHQRNPRRLSKRLNHPNRRDQDCSTICHQEPLSCSHKETQPARSTQSLRLPSKLKASFPLYPAVRGFHNPKNSCFMDSALVGMFAFEGSPFYDNLVTKDLV